MRPLGAGWPLKTCIFRGFGAQKTISFYSFDRIVLIFGYIVQRTNTKILLSYFLQFPSWTQITRRHKWRNFRFCKSCRRAMPFSPLDSSEDFMAQGGLRFSLSLVVSELWRHQWRHNDVISRFAKVVVQRCGLQLHPWPWTIVARSRWCFYFYTHALHIIGSHIGSYLLCVILRRPNSIYFYLFVTCPCHQDPFVSFH